jgi:tRNA U34 5-methylaminomethyl-2-thiouridine-forming methyltransferase MnmC
MNEIVITGDGSTTVYVPGLNEHYHSIHGAVAESRHVFIQNGLHYLNKNPITIFEVGFGTGLNAFLSYQYSQHFNREVNYYALEKYPLDNKIVSCLNFPAILAASVSDRAIYIMMHTTGWGKRIALTPCFTLCKILADLTVFCPDFNYDLIFFDAFSPDRQPEMWTGEVFEKLFNHLFPDGILVTYCAKGSIKRLLKSTGFQVETLAGPPGKREMIRASKGK